MICCLASLVSVISEAQGYQRVRVAAVRLYDVVVPRRGRLGALCGVLGPATFTAAWLVAARRQDEYRVRHEHISGLAARDAVDPHVMTAGFLALGACTMAFASALDRRLAPQPGWGPAMIGAAGLTTMVAGLFRRDRRSNFPLPGEEHFSQSFENDVHDTAGVSIAVVGTAGLFALARRLADDRGLAGLAPSAVTAAVTSLGLSAWFLRDVIRPWNGVVQRVSVTVPLAFMARLGLRLLTEPSVSRRRMVEPAARS
jgi:Protein of unknown function (DUF998)